MMNNAQLITYRIFFVIFILTVLYCFLAICASQNTQFNLALGCLSVCTFVPLLYRIRYSNFNLFEPIYAYTGIFTIFYILSSIYIYNRSEMFTTSMTADIYNTKEMLPVIYVLAFSILCFHFGYNLCLNKSHLGINDFVLNLPQSSKLQKIIILLYSVSIIFRTYGYATGRMGSLTKADGFNFPGVSLLYFVSNIWFVYFTYITTKRFVEGKLKKVWLICLLFEVLIVLISGDRRYIIQIAIIVFMVYYFVKKDLPWKKIGLLSVVFAFVFVPITTMYGYYLDTVSGSLLKNIELFSFVLDNIMDMPISDTFSDFVLNPIAESLFLLPPAEIAYTDYDLTGNHWGAVGLLNLLNNVIPSGFIERIDTRYYYEEFTLYALSYSVDYSPLTFQFTTENILCFGLFSLPVAYFANGLFISFVYKKLYLAKSFSPILYISLFFALCYSTHFGLLTTELITPIRVLIYYWIIQKIAH